MFAATYEVGTCISGPGVVSFATISAAVDSSSVPNGSTILVCPGTYGEQVTITRPLNLTGVTSGTANQALIVVPSEGWWRTL
jgi:pectin methylesterase-like acyl-CoA thioesterase